MIFTDQDECCYEEQQSHEKTEADAFAACDAASKVLGELLLGSPNPAIHVLVQHSS